jgi:hypothetical protein
VGRGWLTGSEMMVAGGEVRGGAPVYLHDWMGFRDVPQVEDEDGKQPAVCSPRGGS